MSAIRVHEERAPEQEPSSGAQPTDSGPYFGFEDEDTFEDVQAPLGDERMAQDIRQMLSGFYLDAVDIDVAVHRGVVTLEGTVRDELSKVLAEDLASAHGALRVESTLKITQRAR